MATAHVVSEFRIRRDAYFVDHLAHAFHLPGYFDGVRHGILVWNDSHQKNAAFVDAGADAAKKTQIFIQQRVVDFRLNGRIADRPAQAPLFRCGDGRAGTGADRNACDGTARKTSST